MKKKLSPSLWKSWSPAKLGLILTCPLAFFFKYVIKSQPTPNIFGVFGEAIHQMVRKFFSLKYGYKSEKTFLGAWKNYWWKQVLDKKYPTLAKETKRKELEKFYAIGTNILKKFYRENIQYREKGLRPLVEKNFSCVFRGHRISGRMDRIQPLANGKRDISDYKTGLRKADEEELARDIQFTFYNLLYFSKYGEDPEGMWLCYLSRGEKVPVPKRNEIDYLILARLLDETTMYVKNILQPSSNFPVELFFSGLDPEDVKTRRFSDRPSHFCNICNYERICHGFQPNDSMLEIYVQQGIESIGFPKGTKQLILFKEVRNETISEHLS